MRLIPGATSHAIFNPSIWQRLRVALFCVRHGHKVSCTADNGHLLVTKGMPS